jgi:hypothetical protein
MSLLHMSWFRSVWRLRSEVVKPLGVSAVLSSRPVPWASPVDAFRAVSAFELSRIASYLPLEGLEREESDAFAWCVCHQVVPYFKEVAAQMISEGGKPEELLARCLAAMTGRKLTVVRSMLSGQQVGRHHALWSHVGEDGGCGPRGVLGGRALGSDCLVLWF